MFDKIAEFMSGGADVGAVVAKVVTKVTAEGGLDLQYMTNAAVAVALLAGGKVALNKAWTSYRFWCKPNAAPMYWATRTVKDKGGVYAFVTLPVAMIETALVPVYGLMSMFMPRPKAERELMSVIDISAPELEEKLERTRLRLNNKLEVLSRECEKLATQVAGVIRKSDERVKLDAQLADLIPTLNAKAKEMDALRDSIKMPAFPEKAQGVAEKAVWNGIARMGNRKA